MPTRGFYLFFIFGVSGVLHLKSVSNWLPPVGTRRELVHGGRHTVVRDHTKDPLEAESHPNPAYLEHTRRASPRSSAPDIARPLACSEIPYY